MSLHFLFRLLEVILLPIVSVVPRVLQSPMFKMEGEKSIADPFAEEARFFTEARLLNRDVQVILEGVVNQNVMGTVLHPVSCIYYCCDYLYVNDCRL